jgi:ABC-type transport system involved in cytochrome bd biosynthesis fused ATPase/permease subunit
MGALSDKTVILVTHQVDFLPVFDTILVSLSLSLSLISVVGSLSEKNVVGCRLCVHVI